MIGFVVDVKKDSMAEKTQDANHVLPAVMINTMCEFLNVKIWQKTNTAVILSDP